MSPRTRSLHVEVQTQLTTTVYASPAASGCHWSAAPKLADTGLYEDGWAA